MFKTIGRVWNANTPKILHPYTKENIIFQLTLAGAIIGGMMIKDHIEANRRNKENVAYMDDYIAGRQ